MFIQRFVGNLAAYSNADNYRTFQLNDTKAEVSVGPAFLASKGNALDLLDVALRYRLSPRPWPETDENTWHLGTFPLSLLAEAGLITPGKSSNEALNSQNVSINAQTQDQYVVKFNYRAYLALKDELPHGSQTWVIPEVGAGISFISTDIKYQSAVTGTSNIPGQTYPDAAYYSKDLQKQTVSPYFSLGMHFFPEHFLSLLIDGTYLPLSYPNSVQIPNLTGFGAGTPFPGHTLPIDAPSSAWSVSARLQMKLVWPTLTHTPLIPQLMPPWLLPSYTTDDISPWVASSEVTKRWNQPGHPSVGNVMFQYKNRWAKRVEIIGEFNDWSPEPMIRDRSGIWLCVKDLPVGKFRYNYVIEGTREIRDPWNKNIDPDSRKVGSSLVVVK